MLSFAGSPPCFLMHAWGDKVVAVENTLLFASALREKGVPLDMYVPFELRCGTVDALAASVRCRLIGPEDVGVC